MLYGTTGGFHFNFWLFVIPLAPRTGRVGSPNSSRAICWLKESLMSPSWSDSSPFSRKMNFDSLDVRIGVKLEVCLCRYALYRAIVFYLQTTRAETKKNQLQNYKFKLKYHVQNYKIVKNYWMTRMFPISQVQATLLQNMLPQLILIDKSFLSRGHPQITSWTMVLREEKNIETSWGTVPYRTTVETAHWT